MALAYITMRKSQRCTEHDRQLIKYGHLTKEGEALLKSVTLRTCLQHIARTGEEPALWSLDDDQAAHLAGPQPATSWFHPICHQSYQPTHPAARRLHAHWLANASKFMASPGAGTVLQCERCCSLFDSHLRPIDRSMSRVIVDIRFISFVQCPGNLNGRCEENQNSEWKMRQAQIKAERDQCLDSFESILLYWGPQRIASHVFSKRPPAGAQEIHMAYLAWRKIWHAMVFGSHISPSSEFLTSYLEGMPGTLRNLRLWGDVVNDCHLYWLRQLDEKTILYTYDQGPEAVEYLVMHRGEWVNECRWLNDYVGRRRFMSTGQFNIAKKSVQRAGTAMSRLVVAEAALENEPTEHNRGIRDNLELASRARFQEVRSAVLADPNQLYRRVTIEGCREPFQTGTPSRSPPLNCEGTGPIPEQHDITA